MPETVSSRCTEADKAEGILQDDLTFSDSIGLTTQAMTTQPVTVSEEAEEVTYEVLLCHLSERECN